MWEISRFYLVFCQRAIVQLLSFLRIGGATDYLLDDASLVFVVHLCI